MEVKKIIVGITGASGSIYAQRLLSYLKTYKEVEVVLVITEAGEQVWQWELRTKPPKEFKRFHNQNFFAPIASGSANYDAMVIIPASMGTIARIAQGVSTNLLLRAADVMLKEQKRLIVVFREAPLSVVHLENLLRLARMGVLIIPAAPAFYFHPKTIEEAVDTIVTKVLDHLGLPHQGKRWGT